MTKHGAKLRAELLRAGVDTKDQTAELARLFGRSTQYIRARLNGRQQWMVDEAYTICKTYEIPFSFEVFE